MIWYGTIPHASDESNNDVGHAQRHLNSGEY